MKIKYQKMYWIFYGVIIIYACVKLFFKIDHAIRTPMAELYTYTSYILAITVELGALESLLPIFKLSPDKIGERIIRKFPNIDPSQTVFESPPVFEKKHKSLVTPGYIIFTILLFVFLWFRFTHQIEVEIYLGTLLNIILWLIAPRIIYKNFKSQNEFYQKMDDLIEEQEFIDAFPDLINRS
jgi:hypothetical protein